MNGLGAFLVDASPGMMVLLKLTGLLGVGLVLNLMLLRMNPRWRVLMWRGVLVGTVVLCVGEVPAPKFLIAFEAVVEAPVAPDVEMSVVVDAFPAGPPEMFRAQQLRALCAIEDFRLHDLQETMAIIMRERLQISSDVVGQVLNHAPQGVTQRHYAATHSVADMRADLNAWDDYLGGLVGEEQAANVVRFPGKR